jgi:protoporphyrinogen/coproporphyrinogen III oxidase
MEIGVPRVAIIGAGMAGLSAAFRLREAGIEAVIFERGEAAGGRTKTVRQNGFTIDVGAGVLPATYVDVIKLMTDAGLAHMMERVDGYVATPRNGKLHLLNLRRPVSSLIASSLIGWGSKLKLLRLMRKLKAAKDVLGFDTTSGAAVHDTESIADFCNRELNSELRDYFIEPLVRTLYLHNAEEASIVELLWCLKNLKANSSFAIKGGMDALARELAKRFDVRYGIDVKAVRRTDVGCSICYRLVDGSECNEEYAACITAADGHDILQLIGVELSQGQQAFLANMQYSTSINLHYKLSAPLDNPALIIQVPKAVDPYLAAIVQDHLKGSGRTPPGKGLVSVFLHTDWGKRMWGRSDDDILADVAPRIEAIVPGFAASVESVHIERWRRAATIGSQGYYQQLQEFENALDTEGVIQQASDIFAPSSVNVAVKQGERAAGRILRRFKVAKQCSLA